MRFEELECWGTEWRDYYYENYLKRFELPFQLVKYLRLLKNYHTISFIISLVHVIYKREQGPSFQENKNFLQNVQIDYANLLFWATELTEPKKAPIIFL